MDTSAEERQQSTEQEEQSLERERRERYSRQMLFAPIGENGQRKIEAAHVAVVGMGALGTVIANHLARSGVGRLRLIDRDYVERSNLQRQMLYDEDDVRELRPKVVAAERRLKLINSEIRIEPVVSHVTAANAERLLDGVDLVLDGTDNFGTRLLLNDVCFKHGIPFIYGGSISSNGMTAVFVPGETSCLRCLLGAGDSAGDTCDTTGVISPIVDIVASLQAAEALKLLVGDKAARRQGLLSIDIWRNSTMDMKLPPPSSSCPTCGLKQYPSLHEEGAALPVTLCGRETVQIGGRHGLDLKLLKEKLSRSCGLTSNPYLLRAELPEGERLVIFPDGRVLVQGTEDLARAQSLYDRYIGS
ncbi:thiazole biosynthesis adenylyltransferase ThiF [Paenibacillus rhizovicinus]|uniref:Thiazole biosynthesis adenylyltransferase ThiF n=1 Tax=Paenibacillus rhizovicinus TaxID=2704463 RepID=A0A6C0P2C8_9BACL|nr:ThiF family adenylyltransferase [Paenibacillus rhizovicinus]QHW32416.1 thiazole biosynthesis adenylyltransferase ThiF [Paenibacillus rhizovicinus]